MLFLMDHACAYDKLGRSFKPPETEEEKAAKAERAAKRKKEKKEKTSDKHPEKKEGDVKSEEDSEERKFFGSTLVHAFLSLSVHTSISVL